jgi:hypothetical protein
MTDDSKEMLAASTALRPSLRADVRHALRTLIRDVIVVQRACEAAGIRVYVVPHASKVAMSSRRQKIEATITIGATDLATGEVTGQLPRTKHKVIEADSRGHFE